MTAVSFLVFQIVITALLYYGGFYKHMVLVIQDEDQLICSSLHQVEDICVQQSRAIQKHILVVTETQF